MRNAATYWSVTGLGSEQPGEDDLAELAQYPGKEHSAGDDEGRDAHPAFNGALGGHDRVKVAATASCVAESDEVARP